MPIFDYQCKRCECQFETFVWSADDAAAVRCPRCQATEIERLMSCFSLAGGSRSGSPCAPKTSGFS
ncbi:MAG TPA: zinc ribbon domain-containing protein [Syntrophobacteraceae bacterium]|nr:zinc ribbon domain-containing protein [Syntrophobacteraceae bacterium]HBD07892.1 zinc ribbon domain-containing protein [Syntrophobacteraceae bacterium]HBZ54251.1 zinc ribbon domain-containing protein [Syntrophobacteraceae bacterium]